MGILSINSPENDGPNLAAFRTAMQRFGYVEGRTIDIDYRASSGDATSLTRLAEELVRRKPQVILANSVTPTRTVSRLRQTCQLSVRRLATVSFRALPQVSPVPGAK